MKKLYFAFFACLFLFGCSEKEETPKAYGASDGLIMSAAFHDKDFTYSLEVLDDVVFNEGDEIHIQASLTYTGDLEEIVITHAASPFYYDIKELTRDYQIDYPMDTPSITTILEKGQTLTSTYKVSGGYSDQDDEDFINFMEQFLTGTFPTGTYAVHGYAKFTIDGESEPNELGATIQFKVE